MAHSELVAHGLDVELRGLGEELADKALRVVERALWEEVGFLKRVHTHHYRPVRPTGRKRVKKGSESRV